MRCVESVQRTRVLARPGFELVLKKTLAGGYVDSRHSRHQRIATITQSAISLCSPCIPEFWRWAVPLLARARGTDPGDKFSSSPILLSAHALAGLDPCDSRFSHRPRLRRYLRNACLFGLSGPERHSLSLDVPRIRTVHHCVCRHSFYGSGHDLDTGVRVLRT